MGATKENRKKHLQCLETMQVQGCVHPFRLAAACQATSPKGEAFAVPENLPVSGKASPWESCRRRQLKGSGQNIFSQVA